MARALVLKLPWVNLLGLLILVLCYVAALSNVVRLKSEEASHDVIRMVHWQLELGVRDGLNEMIRRFEKKKAAEGTPVKIVQILMPEGAYKQYITTQMIGETAPDMVELGFFPSEFFGRYFLPLSEVISRPNPLIAERASELAARHAVAADPDSPLPLYRSLENLPWMDTFRDGLRSQFNDDAQEYYGVGFSQFTVRMFYNKDLFRAAVGTDEPPGNYQELLEYGDKIIAYGEAMGRPLYPIASAKYQTNIFKWRYRSAMTADLERRFDLNLDGWCGGEERTIAILTGEWHPRDPQYRASMTLIKRLTDYFPPGFMSLGRMDSGFAFVQGRAAMITSGSWDARSYLKKIEDQPPGQRFEVGIFDVPMPDKSHPEIGSMVDGPPSEANTGTGFAFGITRFSRHVDLCLEFLQFCTLPENNAVMNRYAEWIPSVKGAEPTDMLKRFEPNFAGFWGRMNFDTGPRGQLVEGQVFWPYISGETDYETYADDLMDQLPSEAALDWARGYREPAEALPNRRARRSALLTRAALADDAVVRERNAVKMLRAWDNLIGYELQQHERDALLSRVKEKADPDQAFNREFFAQLKREFGE